jgi:hypothetical protein
VRIDFVVSNEIDNQISFDDGIGEMKFEETKRAILLNRLKKSFKRN